MLIPINYLDKNFTMAGVMANILSLRYGEITAKAVVFSGDGDIDHFIEVVNKRRRCMPTAKAKAFYKDALRLRKMAKALS